MKTFSLLFRIFELFSMKQTWTSRFWCFPSTLQIIQAGFRFFFNLLSTEPHYCYDAVHIEVLIALLCLEGRWYYPKKNDFAVETSWQCAILKKYFLHPLPSFCWRAELCWLHIISSLAVGVLTQVFVLKQLAKRITLPSVPFLFCPYLYSLAPPFPFSSTHILCHRSRSCDLSPLT